ncbi:MAG: hypothetical protein EBQ95_04610 [Gammaproteobacteria bacterium]|nr:hypothetical protein [Gammaproteobacteria bacterium]
MQNLNEMKDSFFSAKPYKNWTEAVCCSIGYVAAAVALPFLLYAMWPIIAWISIAMTIIALASSAAYFFNYMTDNREHLLKYGSTYHQIGMVSIGFTLLNIIPPIIYSVALAAAAIFRAGVTMAFGFGKPHQENVDGLVPRA